MIFSTYLRKLGRGTNLSVIMNEKDKISIYFFEKGISKKEVEISNENFNLKRISMSLGYNEVLPLTEKYLLTRIDKSLGIINHE